MLALGIILLIGGIVGYFVSAPKMDIIRSGLGMLIGGLSESAAQEFTMWQHIFYGSICALVLGGIFLIAGIIQQVKKK